jgi:5-deoxy-glucuronate isomerase
MSATQWFRPRGALASGDWESVVDGGRPGWEHAGLRVGDFTRTPRLRLGAGNVERMVVPLTGDVRVELDGADRGTVELAGRAGVFDGPSDVLYAGPGTGLLLTGSGRVAVAEAASTEPRPVTVLRAAEVPVELRGAGRSSRQVHNFGVPGGLDAARLIVCEVITPAENWSSYPPHKHDEAVPGTESRLEEIYYFEAAVTRGARPSGAPDPFGMFATYSSPAGVIDITALVRTGDIALVPFGYHGPAAAAPGYDLYYLNVMVGPDAERAWRITDDPAHAWVRDSWNGQEPDPRLPYRAEDLTDTEGPTR